MYLLVSPTAHASWWNPSWNSRITITFDNSAQPGALVNFPVLVVLDNTRIDYGKTQNSGEDIRFVDADDLTPLAYEIEKWDEAGISYVWVQVPQIPGSSSADFIYLYYDHGSETDAQNPAAVWSNGYAGVWHLAEDPTGSNPIIDSTANPKNGVGSASMNASNLVTGRIGDGLDFDGSADYVRVASSAADALAITGSFITLEALVWKNGSTAGDTWEIPFGRQLGSASTDSYLLAIDRLDQTLPRFITTGGGNAGGSNGDVPNQNWTYLAGVQNAVNLRLYVNGSQVRQRATGGVIQTDNNDVTFAGMENGLGPAITEWYRGSLDEIRISTVERNRSWIAAQQLSMLAQTFNTYGAPEAPTAISGTVFEDANFGGGAGRDLATASGVVRSGARVELYDATGNYVTFTTTDGSGNYSFAGLAAANYTVRVANSTVTSSRTGYVASLRSVQTYRTDASSGSAVADTARVGGQDPSVADAGNGSAGAVMNTTTGVFTAVVTGTAQSITNVTLGASAITGVDFGYNFDTIVNTSDTGQGSLRQFIDNANALSNAGLAQVGQTAGDEVSVFMITDGAAHPGLRAGLTNLLSGAGVAELSPATSLPPITGADSTVDGTTQTTNVGDTNAALFGAGGTVGVDTLPLSQVAGPEVEIRDGGGLSNGLQLQANNVTVRGLAILGFGAANGEGAIVIDDNFTGTLIENNVLGTTAVSFTDPGAALHNYAGVESVGGDSGTIQNNLIGFGHRGVFLTTGSTGWTVEGNEIRDHDVASPDGDGIAISGSSGNTLRGNHIVGSSSQGFVVTNSSSSNFVNNTLTGNGVGSTAAVTQSAAITMRSAASSTTIDRNIVHANYGAGIQVNDGATDTVITRNSFADNGTIVARSPPAVTNQIGIDLNISGDDNNLGSPNYFSINDQADTLQDFPILNTATISGGNVTLTGWSKPNATIEVFIAAVDPFGFGEGETYVGTFVEGSLVVPVDTDSSPPLAL